MDIPPPPPPTTSLDEIARVYNKKGQESRASRRKSAIYSARTFHNYLVTMLLNEAIRLNGPKCERRLLDDACGSGGLLPKVFHTNITYVRGTDLSEACIDQAHRRYRAQRHRNRQCRVTYQQGDICEAPVQEGEVDLVSIQFAVHYLFSSRSRLDQYLARVSKALSPGGVWFGTTVNYEVVVPHLMQKSELVEDAFTLSRDEDGSVWHHLHQRDHTDLYGMAYDFSCGDRVHRLQEFLVHKKTLVAAAQQHGLVLKRWQTFFEYEAECKGTVKGRSVFKRMTGSSFVLNPASARLSDLYVVFIFQKA